MIAGTAAAAEDRVGDWPYYGGAALIRFRVLSCQRRRNRRDIGPCLRTTDSGLQSPDTLEDRFAALVQRIVHFAGQQLFRHGCRNPQVGAEDCVHSNESGRSDAYNGDHYVVKPQCLPDDVIRTSKARLPGGIVHHGNSVRSRDAVLFRQKEATLRGPDAQRREVVAGHKLAEHALRNAARVERHDAGRRVSRE